MGDSGMGDIKELVPHRPPFLWVDRAIRANEESGEFELCLQKDDPRLPAGTLSSFLVIEALAQACAGFFALSNKESIERGVLIEINKAKFFATAKGGDTVTLHVAPSHSFGTFVRLECTARTEERILAEVSLSVQRTAQDASQPQEDN
ncbi:hypothetical protein KAI87_14245 [Myxococcota bacterium]|nr:hypothetical protein [Myxococcota bacterium]